MSMDLRSNVGEMALLSKLVYRFNTISVDILADLSIETHKELTYFGTEMLRRTRTILKRKNKAGDHHQISKLIVPLLLSR